jgi:hypothetical protein
MHLPPLTASAVLLVAMLPSFAGVGLWARLQSPPIPWPPLAAGWGVALALALPALWLRGLLLRADADAAVALGLGVNAVRLLTLLLILVAVLAANVAFSTPFMAAAVSGYLCSLVGEVALLHRISLKLWNRE